MASRTMPRSASPVLWIRRIGESIFLFRHHHPTAYHVVVLFLAVVVAHVASDSCKPLFQGCPSFVATTLILGVITALHYLLEPLASRALGIVAEVIGPTLSRAAAEFARHEARFQLLLLLIGLFVALLIDPVDLHADPVAVPWAAIGWLGFCGGAFLIMRRGRIGALPSASKRTMYKDDAAEYQAETTSRKRRLRWSLHCVPASEQTLPVVTDMATLAFGVEGPNSCFRRRAEYMRTIWEQDPNALQLVHAKVERRAIHTTDEGEWQTVQEGYVGYFAVLALRDDVGSQYFCEVDPPAGSKRPSQFEFAKGMVIDPKQERPSYVYLQAMVDIGHFRWYTHRIPRVADFLADQMQRYIKRICTGAEPRTVKVGAEATTDDGRRAITRYFRFLQTKPTPASSGGPVQRSREGHDLFLGKIDVEPAATLGRGPGDTNGQGLDPAEPEGRAAG